MWCVERKLWFMISGFEEGGVYKIIDGGDIWKKLEGGLLIGMMGKVGLMVFLVNFDCVWVIIEVELVGGVYWLDNVGKSWKKINNENKFR